MLNVAQIINKIKRFSLKIKKILFGHNLITKKYVD